jgi:hypothetical protein
MVLMFCLLIKVKLDGTTSQIEDSMLSAILDKENTLQNMFIITISIPKPMSNLELQEVLRVLTQDNSSLKVNSVMKLNGETFLINQNVSNLFI